MWHIWQLSSLHQVHRIVSLQFSQSKKLNNRLLLPPRNSFLLRCIFLWILTLRTANMLQLPGDFAGQKKFHSVIRLIRRFFVSPISEKCSDVRTSESAFIISTNMLSMGSCFTIFPVLGEKISPSL